MKKTILTFCIGLLFGSICLGQGFYLDLDRDTILAGNIVQVTFVVDNVDGTFDAPELSHLNVISGPNTSNSISIVNGKKNQSATYSYIVRLDDIGEAIIPPAYLTMAESTIETEPTSIVVLPNPEGIIEQAPIQSGLYQFGRPQQPTPPKPPSTLKGKKKRKLRKI